MARRLKNWGEVYAGGLPGLTLPQEDPRGDPDLLDAALIEQGMLKMRWQKHLHYKLLKYLYLGRVRSTAEACNVFRKDEEWVIRRHKEGLGFLIRHCVRDLTSPPRRA